MPNGWPKQDAASLLETGEVSLVSSTRLLMKPCADAKDAVDAHDAAADGDDRDASDAGDDHRAPYAGDADDTGAADNARATKYNLTWLLVLTMMRVCEPSWRYKWMWVVKHVRHAGDAGDVGKCWDANGASNTGGASDASGAHDACRCGLL